MQLRNGTNTDTKNIRRKVLSFKVQIITLSYPNALLDIQTLQLKINYVRNFKDSIPHSFYFIALTFGKKVIYIGMFLTTILCITVCLTL